MNPSTGIFISMDTYEGSIYDPDTLHKYLYANGNPVKYSDPSGNMFTLGDSTLAMGIQGIINDATRILYNGVLNGLISTIITAVTGGSWQDAKDAFVAGFIMGAGLSAVRYFVVGAKLVTLARFYVLSATASFIFSVTMTLFAITQGYSEMAIMFSVMVVLSVAEWCWAYGNYLLMDVYGNNGSTTIECGTGTQGVGNPVKVEGRGNTGRTTPNTLNEQMAMHQVMSNPLDGAIDMSQLNKHPIIMTDPRWPAAEGWVKMSNNVNGIEIHFVYNKITGSFDDFKFK